MTDADSPLYLKMPRPIRNVYCKTLVQSENIVREKFRPLVQSDVSSSEIFNNVSSTDGLLPSRQGADEIDDGLGPRPRDHSTTVEHSKLQPLLPYIICIHATRKLELILLAKFMN